MLHRSAHTDDGAITIPWVVPTLPKSIGFRGAKGGYEHVLHVIDGSKIPKDTHGHEAHMRTAVRGSLAGTPAQIVGFYSPKHHAIFTHHDTNTHAHVISDAPMVTGHIDHVDINAGARLFLPAR